MPVPRRLGRDPVEKDINRLKSVWGDHGSMSMEDPHITRNIQPEATALYDIGTFSLWYDDLWIQDVNLGTAGQIYDNGNSNAPRMRLDTAAAASSADYSSIVLEADSWDGSDDTGIEIRSGHGATEGYITFEIDGTAHFVYFDPDKCRFLSPLSVDGGIAAFHSGSWTTVEDGCFQGLYTSEPSGPPGSNGWWYLWVSNGTGDGDAGDLMVKIRSGGATKTHTLVDFSAI